MALHVIPEGEDDRHTRDAGCVCSPAKTEGNVSVGRGANRSSYRGTILTHGSLPPVELHDRHAVPDGEADYLDQAAAGDLPTGVARIMPGEDPNSGPEAACGHVIVQTNAGEWQHHDIPRDDAPHSPTSECGCGPQRHVTELGHVVYEHADQAAGEQDDDEEV